ncbi:MAG: nitroreductase [Spirochaetota bacterium]|nr:nitroreductase [Spirochaetota bacterium]
MELKEAIKIRKSIRGFKPDPVSKKVLSEIMEISVRAPSAMNIQPWEVLIVAGEPLEEIRKSNIEMLSSGKMPISDFGEMKPYEGVYKERQKSLGIELYRLLGIARDDKQKRMEWTMKGFGVFDAPALIILTADECLETRTASSDIGGLIQTICLTALDYGLGTCINGQGIMFPDVVRKALGIPESKKLHICIAIGYPDLEHPANNLQSEREPIENNVTWFGFE